ncbi:Lipocalin-like domain-containing protein [Pyrenochaeta sp. MPI-SDFR-AT-0127]|nr:Lipocalin-like domain-containing protein [Pyrenochaeta sp. MPI-SDFR-AT-0127]
MTTKNSLYNQLIGAWELVSYHAHLPTDPSNKMYPLGPYARGTIMYTPDGHISAQLLRPGQSPFKGGDGISSGTESEWADVGKNFVAYSGRFWLDETGGSKGEPLLLHEMSVSNLPKLVGQVQRRTVNVEEGAGGVRYLNLGVERMLVKGEVRVVRVRWKRMNDNVGAKPPAKL